MASHRCPVRVAGCHSLVHAAVADRPLEEVRLASSPRSPDSADEAIRSAAESRPVEDVTRVMPLLHQPSVASHCAEEAVRTVAARRPVEELVRLIGQLSERHAATGTPGRELPIGPRTPGRRCPGRPSVRRRGRQQGGTAARLTTVPHGRPGNGMSATRRGPPRSRTGRGGSRPPRSSCAASGVCLCTGTARRSASTASPSESARCVSCSPWPSSRAARRGAVARRGRAGAAALATLQLLEGRLHSRALSRALEIGVAPSWAAGLAAKRTGRHPAPRPPADADRVIG